jgi:Holliday junction resolvase
VTNSRAKGVRGELEWRDYLREHGIDARRGRQYAGHEDAPDVVSALDEWFHAEVKRVEALNVGKAVEKAEEDCGPSRVPYVAHRRNRKPWLVTLRACDAVPLMLAAIKGGWTNADDVTRQP